MIMAGAVALLLMPFLAMQFTSDVNWTASDFAIASVMLLGTGLVCELVLRKVTRPRSRFLLCALVLAVLLVVWVELAVGLFGTPFAGN